MFLKLRKSMSVHCYVSNDLIFNLIFPFLKRILLGRDRLDQQRHGHTSSQVSEITKSNS